MGNLDRWLKYAKAKLDDRLRAGNQELDRLEAEREAELAGRPWLGADADSPTLDEARARIEWERAQAERRAEAERRRDDAGDERRSDERAEVDAGAPPADGSRDAGPDHDRARDGEPSPADPLAPSSPAEAAARDQARIELAEREREATARLEAIRAELGVDAEPPGDPGAPDRPTPPA